MKKTLLVLLLLSSTLAVPQSVNISGRHRKIWASAGPAASFVQAQVCHGASGVGNCTTPAMTVTPGDTVGFCGMTNGAATFTSFVQSTGTDTLASFTQVATPVGTTNTYGCFYKLSTTASGSTTFKLTFSVTNAMHLVVFELSHVTGVDGAFPAGNSNTTSTTYTCPSYTTAHSNALVICGAGGSSNQTTISAGTGFTLPTNGSQVSSPNGGMEYEANVGSGTVLNPTFTVTSTSNINFAMTFAFF